MSPAQISAGILLYREIGTASESALEVLLVHPGGPFFARKDDGAWSIPKGLLVGEEEPIAAARREFAEETGHPAPAGAALDLGEVKLRSGKRVLGFALKGDLDAETIVSNTFEMVWPPRSGAMREFPEVDRAQWFSLDDARVKLNAAQSAFIDRLVELVGSKM